MCSPLGAARAQRAPQGRKRRCKGTAAISLQYPRLPMVPNTPFALETSQTPCGCPAAHYPTAPTIPTLSHAPHTPNQHTWNNSYSQWLPALPAPPRSSSAAPGSVGQPKCDRTSATTVGVTIIATGGLDPGPRLGSAGRVATTLEAGRVAPEAEMKREGPLAVPEGSHSSGEKPRACVSSCTMVLTSCSGNEGRRAGQR